MLKYIKEWMKDYNEVQKEWNLMGFFSVSTMFGTYVYFDKELYEEYRKQKEISKQKTLEYEELKQKVAKIDNDIEFIKQILLEQIDGSQRSVN